MLNEIPTRDHLPLPNCNSDGKAKNEWQRTLVWLIHHHSECEEEVIFVNFPCALENVSCQWALVNPPECTLHYTAFTQPRTTPGRPGNWGFPSHSLTLCTLYISFTLCLPLNFWNPCQPLTSVLKWERWERINIRVMKTFHKSDKAHKEDLKEGKGSRKN